MTALAAELTAIIAAEGPMPLSRFMALCLGHPKHGYYITRDPLGVGGDFVTAPEVSQMFGELIGLWCADVWSQMGAPASVRLVELGPGRGTLMADALRAARAVPAFRAALSVHLVETSPALRARQQAKLAAAGVALAWHDRLEDVPAGPMLLIANEFFDALPIDHYVRGAHGWHQRLVGLDDSGHLTFGLFGAPVPEALIPAPLRAAADGSVVELSPIRAAVADALARRLVDQSGAALVIDYGFTQRAVGDTFQAVRSHAYADPLAAPGEADLTSHVDFAALAEVARAAGAAVFGPVAQGAFLRGVGLDLRAAQLKAKASPLQVAVIDAAVSRLTANDQMGRLFQVLALAAPGLRPAMG